MTPWPADPGPAPASPLSTPARTFWVLLGLETVLRWIARATGGQVERDGLVRR
ncbi:MAG: hypothetical protein PGN15_14865 [Aeromicrobium erythreum]